MSSLGVLSLFIKFTVVHSINFSFFSQGDLKSYLRSCQVAESETPDPLILQRMACDIASGLLHIHKYNFIHRYSIPVCPVLFTSISLNTNAPVKNRVIHLNSLCALCWSLPATTSWCCLSSCHELQHQWFCCRGRTLPALPPCGGCHSN